MLWPICNALITCCGWHSMLLQCVDCKHGAPGSVVAPNTVLSAAEVAMSVDAAAGWLPRWHAGWHPPQMRGTQVTGLVSCTRILNLSVSRAAPFMPSI